MHESRLNSTNSSQDKVQVNTKDKFYNAISIANLSVCRLTQLPIELCFKTLSKCSILYQVLAIPENHVFSTRMGLQRQQSASKRPTTAPSSQSIRELILLAGTRDPLRHKCVALAMAQCSFWCAPGRPPSPRARRRYPESGDRHSTHPASCATPSWPWHRARID